ncbi:MAG: hypothetical protein RIR11_979 [Bacteroidota bacterium]|jgi:hypothetical protein
MAANLSYLKQSTIIYNTSFQSFIPISYLPIAGIIRIRGVHREAQLYRANGKVLPSMYLTKTALMSR